eukprot:CAMPEP_0170561120 /NCGR_PEP_ID=MMETSP0211-20121228/52860_1 /TAXON_ID=311385 /ORGANISM="Pseudokeronopsis sp., Strain OXSARD2" /LENGTH=59 /DNA_ID=CAMNT_0010876227 /DNA_START=389 /DNA_END=568 /DNA_ORIENTATION=+
MIRIQIGQSTGKEMKEVELEKKAIKNSSEASSTSTELSSMDSSTLCHVSFQEIDDLRIN